jgi:hypothetical protein
MKQESKIIQNIPIKMQEEGELSNVAVELSVSFVLSIFPSGVTSYK